MQQEPPDKLHGIRSHLFSGVAVASVFVGEYYLVIVNGFDSMI